MTRHKRGPLSYQPNNMVVVTIWDLEQRPVNGFTKKCSWSCFTNSGKPSLPFSLLFAASLTSFCILVHAQLDRHHANTLTLVQSHTVGAWLFHSLCLSPTPSLMAESWLGLQPPSSHFSPLLGLHPGPLLDVPSSPLPAGPAWCRTAEGSQKVDVKFQHYTLRETEIGPPDAMGWGTKLVSIQEF